MGGLHHSKPRRRKLRLQLLDQQFHILGDQVGNTGDNQQDRPRSGGIHFFDGLAQTLAAAEYHLIAVQKIHPVKLTLFTVRLRDDHFAVGAAFRHADDQGGHSGHPSGQRQGRMHRTVAARIGCRGQHFDGPFRLHCGQPAQVLKPGN
ncbi:hypothetical protein D3C75_853330 [compost metagenome]